MPGYRCRHWRWNCDEKGCYTMSLPSWDDLLDCFPRGIRPTDIDGMVEINGWVLIIDQKEPGKTFEEGQRRAYNALRERPNTTVVGIRDGLNSEVEVIILPSEAPPSGAGEMGIPSVAPALANAVYAATTVRVRRLPLLPELMRRL